VRHSFTVIGLTVFNHRDKFFEVTVQTHAFQPV